MALFPVKMEGKKDKKKVCEKKQIRGMRDERKEFKQESLALQLHNLSPIKGKELVSFILCLRRGKTVGL